MKNKVSMAIIALMMILGLSGCQYVTKNWGGNMEFKLPENRKLLEVTWKDDNLWYLTREMKADEEAETYYFNESDNLGILEGQVTIIESKTE